MTCSLPVLSWEPQVPQGFWNNWEQRFFDSEMFEKDWNWRFFENSNNRAQHKEIFRTQWVEARLISVYSEIVNRCLYTYTS
jgi:hypothetical protein